MRVKPTTQKKKSRPQRMKEVIKELNQLYQEYEHWLNRVPENLNDTIMVEDLEETMTYIDEVLEILSGITLPERIWTLKKKFFLSEN